MSSEDGLWPQRHITQLVSRSTVPMTTPIPYGVHLSMPAEEYHRIPGASASRLKILASKSPAHLKAELDEPRVPTADMIFGTLCHHALLEPNKPFPKIAIPPKKYPLPASSSLVKKKQAAEGDMVDWNFQTDFCKDWRDAQQSDGNVVMSQKDYEDLIQCALAIAKHPVASPYFRAGMSEVSIVLESQFGITMRCRLDWVPRGLNTLLDAKFGASSDPRKWEKHAVDMGYHIQAWSNLLCWNTTCGTTDPRNEYRFAVVETKRPYPVTVFPCSSDFLDYGREEYEKAFVTFSECLKSGVWNEYATKEVPLKLPYYIRNKREREEGNDE